MTVAEPELAGSPEPGEPAERQPLLALRDVSRVYGEQVKVYAMRDVSLEIFAADHMAIIGPSGSGKSTMLGLLGVLDLSLIHI